MATKTKRRVLVVYFDIIFIWYTKLTLFFILSDWENAFKNIVLKTNNQMDISFQQQHLHRLEDNHQMMQFEDLRRLHDVQRRNALLNSVCASQANITQNGKFFNIYYVKDLHYVYRYIIRCHTNESLSQICNTIEV